MVTQESQQGFELERRNKITLIRNKIDGLLSSERIIRHISDIPCDIIHDLENDAQKAEQFIEQLEKGQVPQIIKDLPEEVIGTFKDVMGIFVTLPSQLVNAAGAAVTDAAKLFNDIENGAIISDLEKLPNVVVSDITKAWGDLTSGLEDDWKAATHAIACFFSHCPVSTKASGSCRASSPKTTVVTHPNPTSTLPQSSPVTKKTSSLPTLTQTGHASTLTPITHVQSTSHSPSTKAQQTSQTPKSQSSLQISTHEAPVQTASPKSTTTSANAGSSTSNSQVASSPSDGQPLLRPSLLQLCWLSGFGLAGIAFML